MIGIPADNIHGGHILQMCDRVAYACAARYFSRYVVTLSVGHVLFKQPIHVGELVEEAILRKEMNLSFTQEHERRKEELRSRFKPKR